MHKKASKKHLGPLFKINTPKFQFEEADQEEKYVENVFEHQSDQQQQLQYHNATYPPKSNPSGEQQLFDDIEQHSQAQQQQNLNEIPQPPKHFQSMSVKLSTNKKKAEPSKRFVKQSPMLKSLISEQELLLQRAAQEEALSVATSGKAPSKFSEDLFKLPKLRRLPQNLSEETQSMIQLTSNSKKVQQQQLQQQQYSQPLQAAASQRSIIGSTSLTNSPIKVIAASTEFNNDNISDTEQNFPEKGLNTNKRLKLYDCWDEETTAEQWMEKCRSQSKGPHAMCPRYVDRKYFWTPVDVLKYDKQNDKFLVQVHGQNIQKWVVRLSIKFNEEDLEAFKERVELSKQRQINAEDEKRFLKYVDTHQDGIVSVLSAVLKEGILKKVNGATRYKQKGDQQSSSQGPGQQTKGGSQQQIQLSQSQQQQPSKQQTMVRQRLLGSLMQETEMEYVRFMKKCIVLKEMQDPRLSGKWIQLRIRNRREIKHIPYYGTIEQLNFPFNEVQNELAKIHISQHKLQIQTMNMITTRTWQFQNHRLFNTQLNESDLPISYSNFEAIQKAYHYQARQILHMQWREYIISEIQDTLRDIHRFYMTESKDYFDQGLQHLLKRIDFMFNTYMRENVVQGTLEDYQRFLKHFTIPEKQDPKIWNIRQSPLLILNLTVNTNFGAKKKDRKKAKKPEQTTAQNNLNGQNAGQQADAAGDGEDEGPEDQAIYFEPNLQTVQTVLLRPLEQLVETVNGYFKLEKDLVPLIDLKKESSFEISLELPWIKDAQQRILMYLAQGYEEPNAILTAFQRYNFLMEKSASSIVRHLLGDPKEHPQILSLDAGEVEAKLHEYLKAKLEIERLCIDEKNLHFFQVKTHTAKEILIAKATEVNQEILKRISDIVVDNVERISKNYVELIKNIQMQPLNEKQLVELQNIIAENDVNLAKMNTEVNGVYQFILIMEKYNYPFEANNMNNYWYLKTNPAEVKEAIMLGKQTQETQQEKFMNNLNQEKDKFFAELTALDETFKTVCKFSDYQNSTQKIFADASLLQESIEKALDKVKSFNEREVLFKQSVSEYQVLTDLIASFDPYYQMWQLAISFKMDSKEWTTGSFLRLDYSFIEKRVNQEFFKKAKSLQKVFAEKPDELAESVVKEILSDIQKFRENLWLIELLTCEAMKNTKKSTPHWREIFQRAGEPEIDPSNDSDMTLENLINTRHLNKYRDIIEDVSKKAEKQWLLEKKLKEMEDKCKGINLEINPYKQTGTFVLRGVDEVQQLLDDQLNILMMMKASPYIKQVLKTATTLEQKIVLMQDTLEGWIKCQRGWMYLEPIFASDDIKKKMQTEKQKFDGVDTFWRNTMEKFSKETSLWDGVENDKLKAEFNQNNKTLDVIQKSLSEYLESKRRAFPRFYFLSDEELLEILADTKDPLKVQKHINKCFEAINLLEFSPEQCVLGMVSSEKETVKFNKQIDVNEGDRKGNVEKWLLDIERQMIETLIRIARDAMADDKTARTKWVQKWPGQIVLAINMMRWTKGAESAISYNVFGGNSGFNSARDSQVLQESISPQHQQSGAPRASLVFPGGSLNDYLTFLKSQLMEIVELVRQDLTDLARLTLGALVVLDVHAKDTIEDLAQRNCNSVHDFYWISQLRYYWEEKKNEQILWVKMINAALRYGFEYLGNSARLVITPLTDRCYRTLMGAFHLQYGGAPEGPAGTGKTETVKDLAKACAVQCVVFNCSDGLNFLAMRKFFKGLASSGAWCCFDEFNRIDLEVLSVIAQQVFTIQTAIKEKRKVFMFDDEEIALIPSCCINITMNPGYAGRSELPDNLKAQFRPCAMMVPDYAMISEIYLYSVGFQDARNLARKVVASLRLSSEQLSSQDHYDFGMRAVKAILTAAGNLKRVMLDSCEDIICLRALGDVNLPKFTINDVPLFKSITSDLFPGIELPNLDYGKLLDAIKAACSDFNLQPQENFLNKCIQLYDTINVRHGLMLVGAAFSGKTKVLESLQRAISSLKGTLPGYVNTVTHKLNPKSVTSDQLYGRLDADTKQWSDGVVAIIMRVCAQDCNNPERKWVVFDGPVDAVWIENMNTVLDDNKKLCLTSGEIIKLSNWMTMMFEVEDLAQASPATVSRCGMVFLETKQLGWDPLVISFVKTIPKVLEKYKESIETLMLWLIDCTLAWAMRYGKFLVHKSEMALVNNCIKLMRSFLADYEVDENNPVAPSGGATANQANKLSKDFEEQLANMILFSTIWSIGAALEETTRKGFHEFVSKLITAASDIAEQYKLDSELRFKFVPRSIPAKIPEKTSIFDLCYDKGKNFWPNWTQTVEKYIVPTGGEYNTIIVPTSDSIRNNYFLHRSVKAKQHILICGSTGTGKTVNIISELNRYYFNMEYTNLTTSFSGQTKANQVQRLIESKVCTRRRKGYFGPEDGKKYIVIFIDDLNMPAKEKYGAQPPIELLRQWMDTGGFYDLDTKEWKFLQDITFVTSMLPPTGGRNVVTLRYLRHFNLLYVEPFEKDSLQRIFSNILEWYFKSQTQPVSNAITGLKDKIVDCTIDLYQKIQVSKELLPTPAKSHYIYNLRDISKVFQGIAKATYKSYKDDNDFLKLWAHECQRVFQDRLINSEDQEIFDKMLKDIMAAGFKRDWDTLVTIQPLLWASFVPTLYPDGDTTKRPMTDIYCELTDREALRKKCYEQLEEYNNFYTGNRMSLVLFMSAIQHILKIVRVITTSFGHCLLVGVGGSGRKSLATLSSFIAFTNEPTQVDQRNWVEELQKLMKASGLDGKEIVFLFSDTQIQQESMVEDICNILNNGEVPNLFPAEEKAKILEDLGGSVQGSNNEKYQYFVKQCKTNLHLVLAFSPVGEAFRRRLRTFPSLVNCTTIDWFLPWPEEALRNTANNHFLQQMGIQDEKLRNGLVDVAVDMQMRIIKLSRRYLDELRRYYYVTPTSYLELLATFKKLTSSRQDMMQQQIKRYDTGVQKIVTTESVVEGMKIELHELQPQLVQQTEENSKMLIILQKSSKEADIKKEKCEEEEKECNVQRESANVLREDCKKELDKVLPILADAQEALKQIKKSDIDTLKSFKQPPEAAAFVMKGICYAFDEDQNVKFVPKAPGSLEKIQDFWDYSKKKLLNDKLVSRVQGFNTDAIKSIPPLKIEKLKAFVQEDLFQEEVVKNASSAAYQLSKWIRAVVQTYQALLVVEPKQIELKQAEEVLAAAEAKLREKKAQLQEAIDKVTKLKQDFEERTLRKEELQRKVTNCEQRLQRAEALTKGLGGEKISWQEKADKFRVDTQTVIGDCMLASGIIAYLGAFPIAYREESIKAWAEILQRLTISTSPAFTLQDVLCDPLTIGVWTNQQKLPNDSFSIDNAIILKNSTRWPLMIDPQSQANTWVRNMEGQGQQQQQQTSHNEKGSQQQANTGLQIMRPTHSANDLSLRLESSIQYGYAVLLENISENIEPVFEPVLQQKLIKQGSSYKIKFGDKFIDYNTDFRFYMTTKMARPHYPPEICVKVTLLNFQVTFEGLEDQMLNIVVQIEEPVKDQQRQRAVQEYFELKEKQKRTQDLILKMLNDSQGDLLEDDALIKTLQNSQSEQEDIKEKLKKQEQNTIEYKGIRDNYKEVAKRVSALYFVVLDLALIEPTYQWSLESYIVLFRRSVERAGAIPRKENKIDYEQRRKNIIAKFQSTLYESICRALLEKDKLIFSFLMCIKIMESEKKITPAEIRYLMVGVTATEPSRPIPSAAKSWLPTKVWCSVLEVSTTIKAFANFDQDFERDIEQWHSMVEDPQPLDRPFPGRWQDFINAFQKLIIVRALFPDKFSQGVQRLIAGEMDETFIQPPPFNLDSTYNDSEPHTPLIFILSPGADPRSEIQALASRLGKGEGFKQISLGQGQGEMAERSIKEAIQEGKWILLQNCHLAPSFMPDLDRILENMPADCNAQFRIWLTSMPSNVFPPTILMKGLKMTFEPPRGIKNNLLRSFLSQDNKKFEDSKKPHEWKKLFFGLAFFHALILERRKYGPLGWNIPYEFTTPDFTISYSQLKMFLDEYEEIPWDALNYMVAEANYGGRVTDPKDRRLIKVLLKDFYSPPILNDEYRFSTATSYYVPTDGPLESYKQYIRDLPLNDPTDIFGLHSNAEISSAIIETNFICTTILSLLPRTSGAAGLTPEQIVKQKLKQLLEKLPQPFNLEEAARKHPITYQESMNTVLQQELIRFNKLLQRVKQSMIDLGKAIDGLLVMSSELEEVNIGVFDNRVPDIWHKVSYPSLKPLGSWILDFVERLNFMQKWIDNGAPPSFWISGFFFTQSFLTGTLQNFARKYKTPIDTLQFDFFVLPSNSKEYDVSKSPADGCYVYGLFFDGGRWDETEKCINESHPKELYSKIPYIWLLPTDEKREYEKDQTVYECPVYKTSRRAGTLSTTGHSTNFVISMFLPISQHHKPEHWIKRGLAALTQLDD